MDPTLIKVAGRGGSREKNVESREGEKGRSPDQ